MDRFNDNNQGRFDLSGNNQPNMNYPHAPPPPMDADQSSDNSRFDLGHPLMGGNANHNYPSHPTAPNSDPRYDMNANVQIPPAQVNFQMPPIQMNINANIHEQNQGVEYVKPIYQQPDVRNNYDQSSGPLSGGNVNVNVNLPPGYSNANGYGMNIPQMQQPIHNVNLPPMDNQHPGLQQQYTQQNQQLNASNVNLPQPQNMIPNGQPITQNPQVPYHLRDANTPQPTLQAQQIPMNQSQTPYYQPPQYPMGAPVMYMPSGAYQQSYQNTIVVVSKPAQSPAPTNLDHCQFPARVRCPSCQKEGTSTVDTSIGQGAVLLCCLGSFFIGACSLVFLCMDNFQDKNHHCPNCGFQVGKYAYKPC